MGYTTEFEGVLVPDRPFTEEEKEYFNRLMSTRRMKRNVDTLWKLYKGEHGNPFAVNKDDVYGVEGEFFAKDDGYAGQTTDSSILDYNLPPSTQPGLWCNWYINDDGNIEWDGSEKFYHYREWLQYIVNVFLSVWNIKVSGEIKWRGEDFSDIGVISVNNNVITIKEWA